MRGKKVFITGASGGIGSEIARSMHAQGAFVILSGRSSSKLESLATELKENVRICLMDLSSPDDIKSQYRDCLETFGGVDIFIYNAGMTKDVLFLRMKDTDWYDVINTNLNGLYHLTHCILPFMIKQRSGSIITISSVVGLHGNAGQVNYSSSKSGMIGFTKSLAREVAKRNISVNCIAPGFIATAMTDSISQAMKDKILDNIPLGRFGHPSDVASLCCYLASSSYITGQVFQVDGGLFI